ncbi:hypothetical protein ACFCZ4_21660 [Streptomyces microflavus]|uniref:hypothetical protein n=1 Tax=Streptomyces microflavus TaxID=1919 RepID=UPI0035E20576
MDRCTRTKPALGTGTRPCPPQRDDSPRRRSARALGLASTGVLLSACAHVLATGAALPPTALAAGGVVAAGVMFPLTGRRPSVALGTAALAVLQSVLHLLFAALTPSVQSAHSLAGVAHGHAVTPQPYTTLAPTLPMLCGHLLAAAVLAWLLHHGELAAEQLSTPGRTPVIEALRGAVLALCCRPCLGQCSLPQAPERAFPHTFRRPRPFGGGMAPARGVTRRGPPTRDSALG